MRLLFMGTPDFSRVSLEKLYNEGYDICGVVTAPDRPSGRGNKIIFSEVKQFALDHNLKLFQPEKIAKNDEFKDAIRELDIDLVIVVSYGIILPKSFLQIPKLGCINVHPSMLPKYRGPAPIQWAVINGDKTTGVTIMYLDAGMDSGDIIKQQEVEIGEDETTGELWNRLSVIGADLLEQTVNNISNNIIERTPQSEEYTIAPMLSKEMSKVDWENAKAIDIKNLTRGLNPIMGTYSEINGKKIKFWRMKVLSEEEFLNEVNFEKGRLNVRNGTILFSDSKKGLYVKANDGVISILEIQGENAKRMNILDFLRGNRLETGERFE